MEGPKFLSVEEVRAEKWATHSLKEEHRTIETEEVNEWLAEETSHQRDPRFLGISTSEPGLGP